MYIPNPKVIGYHGTYPENISSITEHNFHETKDHVIWLGDGVYFFIDGVGSLPPEEYAKQFAIDQCFNKQFKIYTKTKYSILEATIKINDNKYLDLTDKIGNQLFNEFRDKAIRKIELGGKSIIGQYSDTDILKVMRDALGIEFVKSNLYIKFAKQRIGRFESIIPNVTVLVVNNPTKNIQRLSIKEKLRGEIL